MMKICPHKFPRLTDYETTKHLVCHLKESANVITIISWINYKFPRLQDYESKKTTSAPAPASLAPLKIMHGCQKLLENITSGYGNHKKKY